MSQPTHTDPQLTQTNTKIINTTGDRISLAVSALMFLGGLWLMAAPFIVDYQHRTGTWTGGTISIFTVGGAATLIALITGTMQIGGQLLDLSHTNTTDRHDDPTTDNTA